jgi:hypothetical protein
MRAQNRPANYRFLPRFGACVSALPAAERAALLKRRSPTTLAAAFAAFGPVVPWCACARALAAALLAVFDVLVASTRPAFEATVLLVFPTSLDSLHLAELGHAGSLALQLSLPLKNAHGSRRSDIGRRKK